MAHQNSACTEGNPGSNLNSGKSVQCCHEPGPGEPAAAKEPGNTEGGPPQIWSDLVLIVGIFTCWSMRKIVLLASTTVRIVVHP